MKPATAAALTPALAWSDVSDVMWVRTQADSNHRSGLEINMVSISPSGKQSYSCLTPPAFVHRGIDEDNYG